MPKALDIRGRKFGRLTAIEPTGQRNKSGQIYWTCSCDCGKTLRVTASCLVRGNHTVSCGCWRNEACRTHGEKRTRLYRAWLSMRQRCRNPNCDVYHHYGGRGIAVCAEWESSFEAFRDWALANGYSDDLSIDRIDNDKGYSPDNCRWATELEQHNNTRANRHLSFRGVLHTVTEWSRITKIPEGTIRNRIKVLGWTTERALTEPVRTAQSSL